MFFAKAKAVQYQDKTSFNEKKLNSDPRRLLQQNIALIGMQQERAEVSERFQEDGATFDLP